MRVLLWHPAALHANTLNETRNVYAALNAAKCVINKNNNNNDYNHHHNKQQHDTTQSWWCCWLLVAATNWTREQHGVYAMTLALFTTTEWPWKWKWKCDWKITQIAIAFNPHNANTHVNTHGYNKYMHNIILIRDT